MTIVNTKGYTQDEDGQWWKHFKDRRKTRARIETCVQCGQDYPNWKEPRQFCSVACRVASTRVPLTYLNCLQCGNRFQSGEKGQRYCSHSCAATAMHAAKPSTSLHTGPLKNADDPRYALDAKGQWWYQTSAKRGGRVRARVKQCEVCGEYYLSTIFSKKGRTCSHRCGMELFHRENPGFLAGSKSGLWKGGKHKNANGYVMVYAPDHPDVQGTSRKYVLEHRLVMEKKLGRLLLPTEHVHHKNGVRDDNRLRNLELWANAHPPGQRESDVTAEQVARDMLDRMGVANAQNFTAGDLVELANLVANSWAKKRG